MDSEQRLNCVWLVSLVLAGLVMFFLASSTVNHRHASTS